MRRHHVWSGICPLPTPAPPPITITADIYPLGLCQGKYGQMPAIVIFWRHMSVVGTNAQHALRINVTYDSSSIRCSWLSVSLTDRRRGTNRPHTATSRLCWSMRRSPVGYAPWRVRRSARACLFCVSRPQSRDNADADVLVCGWRLLD